jgi:hypothetical protein
MWAAANGSRRQLGSGTTHSKPLSILPHELGFQRLKAKSNMAISIDSTQPSRLSVQLSANAKSWSRVRNSVSSSSAVRVLARDRVGVKLWGQVVLEAACIQASPKIGQGCRLVLNSAFIE